jgi:hypothetical protein
MRNLTITVDEKVARWARIWAAKQGSSISKLVGKLLEEQMRHEQGYATAMRRDLAREPLELKEPGTSYPSREDLHDRGGVR